jgi:isopentenyldiphosphate isomerase
MAPLGVGKVLQHNQVLIEMLKYRCTRSAKGFVENEINEFLVLQRCTTFQGDNFLIHFMETLKPLHPIGNKHP